MKRKAISFLVMLTIFTVSAAIHSPVHSMEVVHFPSALLPSAKPASNQQTNAGAPTKGQPIWGHLGKPKGSGPFPALVLMHGCGGIHESHLRWAKLLNQSGYVTLVLDSFRPRSIVRMCSRTVRAASQSGRALDAFGALRFLQDMPIVDNDRVGLIGWSHGAGSALNAVSEFGIASKFANRFRLAIAFYPFCISDRSFDVPVLVLIGDKDDWTPASYCRELRDKNAGGKNAISLKVYDGAHHGFDNADLGSGFFVPGEPGGRHWLQFDRSAHQDAVERVKRFLGDHLSR